MGEEKPKPKKKPSFQNLGSERVVKCLTIENKDLQNIIKEIKKKREK